MLRIEPVAVDGFEEVVRAEERAAGLVAFVAVHDTTLGPALGGTRHTAYPSEDAALGDVLRLAAGMTRKASLAGLDLGGGKAVVVGDPRTAGRRERLLAYAEVVESLGGRYLTAEDVGTSVEDMVVVREVTAHVTGLPPALGGLGDPSPWTARGVVAALRGWRGWADGDAGLTGLHVAVLGVGKVGGGLARLLAGAGCTLTVADTDGARARAVAEALGAEVVAPDGAHRVDCDVLSPCALGGLLTGARVQELSCRAVVGAANNQLGDDGAAELLRRSGIDHVPDYLANAGGLLSIAEGLGAGDPAAAEARIDGIEARTAEVLARAADEGVPPHVAADRRADERLRAARASRRPAARP